MSNFDYDLFVIGAGSGGVRASRMSAAKGARVAIAEDRYMGGTCVNVGCVPKKLYVYGSHIHDEIEGAKGFGWNISGVDFDWPTLRDNKTTEISRLNDVYRNILSSNNVELIEGRATITGPNQVVVGDKTYTAERILIATGGWPMIPDIPGKEHIITSNEVFDLDVLPHKAMVLGGGYIAVEFAGIFKGLGVDTSLIYRGPMFLRGFDNEVRNFVKNELDQKGIDLRFETNIVAITKTSDGRLEVELTTGDKDIVDCVLAATGRVPNIASLGLENTAVTLDAKGFIEVDSGFQSREPSIYAVGDVIGGPALTPVALAEGMALAHNLYGNDSTVKQVDYSNIATAVFCQPNIGTVGLSEEEALEQGYGLNIYTTDFKHMKHTLSGLNERTFMKLIVDKNTDKVLGCHMVGSEAGEIIQGIAIAMKAGVTKAQFDDTIGIHPTAAEEFVTMREITRTAG
ncbi:MAG: glutathione-disulfide reductase [Candidatus Pelagadaptatus aseana]|uniref:glutathione-disulfide reductase n=1 Tax=Candidatus Pelagadaptatus aseana TaxID=3120508 RepID=UPI0039B35AF2